VQDARWEVAVKNLLVTTVLCLAFLDPPAAAAQTIRYDVTTSTFIFFTSPGLATTTERIEITDRGPQADPDVTPRWESEALPIVVWDVAPGHLSTPDLFVFGNHCASIPAISGEPLARVVQDEHGGGNFAWVPGQNPLDGSIDPPPRRPSRSGGERPRTRTAPTASRSVSPTLPARPEPPR
jgi:hypothetical protein